MVFLSTEIVIEWVLVEEYDLMYAHTVESWTSSVGNHWILFLDRIISLQGLWVQFHL
jgi:hypothetical protein